ncbi:uncharacterized protein METZ01_LOCUS420529, partial [marine metagenome]
MNSFIEFDEEKKSLKSINLDDFSIEDLEEYIEKLTLEIHRSEEEIKKRLNTKEQ